MKKNQWLFATLVAIFFLPLTICAKVYKGTITIEVGQEYSVDVSFGSYVSQTGYWSKSNSTFVFRNQGNRSCTIRGNEVGSGTLEYVGFVGGDDYECYWDVEVVPKKIRITKITLSKTSLSLHVGEKYQLSATVYPNNATIQQVKWYSDNPQIWSDNTGLITVEREGTATITCVAQDGSGIQASCTITASCLRTTTSEGITIKYSILSDDACQVFGLKYSPAIDKATTGKVVIPSTVQGYHVIGVSDYAFYECSTITSVSLPPSVQSIGDYAFAYCNALTEITGTDNLERIGNFAFHATTWRDSWPDGMIYIGKALYEYKGGIPYNISVKDGTLSISRCAFVNKLFSDRAVYSSTYLSSLSIPSSVEYIGYGPLTYSPQLTSVTVSENNKYYDSRNNCNAIIEKSTNTLIVGCNATKIPSDVKTIGEYAFHGSKIASLTIPESVENIAYDAFGGCDVLETVAIQGSTIIAGSAFRDNTNLHSVYVLSKEPSEISDYAFDDYDTPTLYVPYGCKTKYQSTLGWKKFNNIVEFIQVTGILLNEKQLTLDTGKTVQLTATVLPDNATEKSVTWSSSNSDVAAVSDAGLVTADAAGTATIICTANDGSGVKATCTVTVSKPKLPKWDIKSVSSGRGHTMILNTDGKLWACGSNEYGQLGDGTTRDVSTPKQVMNGVASVSAGGFHSMILKSDGTLWACGRNVYGQLGDDTTTDVSTPKQVMSGVVSVSAGGFHTMILKADGTLWACGNNYYGQLGDGTTTDVSTPKQVMNGVASVWTGNGHTMVLKIDGTLWACGSNEYGQLGDGTTRDVSTPKQVMNGVTSVSAGDGHTMILKTDGTLWVCGNNSDGQLGNGTTTGVRTPKQVMNGVVSVSAGGWHTMILKTDGTLWACGRNVRGQLGDGTTTDVSTPKQVMSCVASVSAGLNHTMILKTDGTLWACGNNYYGQLGDGTTIAREIPVQVADALANVTTIKLPESATVVAGEKVTLTPDITPADAATTLTWASGNEAIATVDANGVVTGVAEGETFITVETGNGLSARCKVTVTQQATSISLNQTAVTLQEKGSCQLSATIMPDDATDKSVSWSSNKPNVATVDENGFVTAVGVGVAIITCTANDGSGVSATCRVTVEAPSPVPVTKIVLNQTEASLKVGQSLQLSTTVLPADATDKSVSWSSNKPNVAKVDDNGFIITMGVGVAIITCKANDGSGVTATCRVTVEPMLVTKIVLHETEASLLIGQAMPIFATILPDDATDKSLSWSSNKPNVAEVDKRGEVTAVGVGVAIITCTANDGSRVSATCRVTVEAPEPIAISVQPESKTIYVGETFTATYTLNPSYASTTVTWSSDNEKIATVNQDGKVTGVKAGTTCINVETNNGKMGWCELTVVQPDAVRSIGTDTNFQPSYIYSVTGQRLTAPRKGINIINGKKVLVK